MMPYCGSTTRWRLQPSHTTMPHRRQWWRALTCCALDWKVDSHEKCAPQHAHDGGASSNGVQRGGGSGATCAALTALSAARYWRPQWSSTMCGASWIVQSGA